MMRVLLPADWRALLAVRESRMQRERERNAAARRSAAVSAGELQATQRQLAQREAARLALAQDMRAQAGSGAMRVDALRGGSDYGSRLDGFVAEAAQVQQAAAGRHAQREAALAERLRALHRAAARLRATETLQQRQQQADAALREQRTEDQIEDSARQQWLAARPGA